MVPADLHDASKLQATPVLDQHVGDAEGQPIDAQLQIAHPERAAQLALDVFLEVYTSIG